jgi:hypothetical protein
MTWYHEQDADSGVLRLRFEDAQGQVKGPFTVEWADAPRKRFASDGQLIAPDWQTVAMVEAKSEAANGNSERAIQMLADAIARNVENGQP